MILATGLDAASIPRMRALIERFGERFTARVFTPGERSDCESRRGPEASYAARFAAKEAVMKALAAGWGSGVRFIEIEVTRGARGEPGIRLHGGARERAAELGVSGFLLTLTHEADLALALALAQTAGERS